MIDNKIWFFFGLSMHYPSFVGHSHIIDFEFEALRQAASWSHRVENEKEDKNDHVIECISRKLFVIFSVASVLFLFCVKKDIELCMENRHLGKRVSFIQTDLDVFYSLLWLCLHSVPSFNAVFLLFFVAYLIRSHSQWNQIFVIIFHCCRCWCCSPSRTHLPSKSTTHCDSDEQ